MSELYAPIGGTIASVNNDLADEPEKLNSDPYGEGWNCTVTIGDATELDGLLDAAAYKALTEG